MVKEIIKIGATWCGPCRALDATLKNFSKVPITKLDVDDDDVSEYDITVVPVLIFRDEDHNELHRVTGAVSLEEINNILDIYE